MLAFVIWIGYSFPSWRDFVWLVKGGGLLVRGAHPPALGMQYATSWRNDAALVLITIAMAHVYFRTLDVEVAFSAMASGQVDVNWAKQHHSLWADREIRKMEEGPDAEVTVVRMAAGP